jgi:hypothetical protein
LGTNENQNLAGFDSIAAQAGAGFSLPSLGSKGQPQDIKAFDYKVITVEASNNHQIESDLNSLGEHGWELVGHTEPAPGKIRLILKKPTTQPAVAQV